MRPVDLVGHRYGMLVVLSLAGKAPRRWQCVCDCGGRSTVTTGGLCSGNTKSCGCRKAAVLGESTKKHGGAGTKLYRTWKGMLSRCYNKKAAAYKNYGGRGISVCKRWHDFARFRKDMGGAPVGCSLDRRNNDKGYSPRNCYWATRKEQSRNTRRNVNVRYLGSIWVAKDVAVAHGIRPSLAHARIRMGWPVLAACTVSPGTTARGSRGSVPKRSADAVPH